jgi:ParB family chromosome partitioning protein
MGVKNSYGAVGRGDTLNFKPETLKVITDPKHELFDPRVNREIDESLVLSIMKRGIIVPLVITRDGDSVYVVDGRQRRTAALEANKRLAKENKKLIVCPCIWKRGDEKDLYGITITTNELRTGDSPLERARKMQKLADMNGGDLDEVAVDFGCTIATVKSGLALLECAAPVQHAVEAGKVSAFIATKLSRLTRDEQITTLEKMIESGATKGTRASTAIKKKEGVEKKEKLSTKARHRVLDALVSVPMTEKDDVMRAIIATLDFIAGEKEAFKSWPHIEALVISALMPTTEKTKKAA